MRCSVHVADILQIDGLGEGSFALVDVDERRLDLARRIAERLVELRGKRWAVVASPADLSALFDEMWQAERPFLAWFEV